MNGRVMQPRPYPKTDTNTNMASISATAHADQAFLYRTSIIIDRFIEYELQQDEDKTTVLTIFCAVVLSADEAVRQARAEILYVRRMRHYSRWKPTGS
jgi:hypothetical protein